VVTHVHNPSYSGGGDWEDHVSRPVQAKSSRDPISTNGWAWCNAPVISATQRSTKSRITVQANLGVNQDPVFKVTVTKRVAQVVEHLPIKCKALRSTTKLLKKK
jgi:hypothetical protein